jgi:O-antigen ligase
MPPAQIIEGAESPVTAISIRQRLERPLKNLLFLVLCTLLAFGPLALGIVQGWSTAVFETGAAILLLIWMAWQLAGSAVKVRWDPLFVPMVVFSGLILVQIVFHLSAYIPDSLSELWLYIAYGILAFVAVQLFATDKATGFGLLLLFGKIIAVFGSLYAVFAVLQGLTSDGKIYWLITPRAGTVYGSYVNHNHYAGLMELLLPFALMLGFGFVHGAKRVLLAFGALLMATSVFLSQSRGGMFAVVVEMVFLAIFWMRRFSPRKSAALFATFSLATALFLSWIAPQQVASRITDVHDPARWLIHRDSIRMFAAHPLLGSGFGSFATAFPHYRVFDDGFFINYAHDDYLELLLETGTVGFSIAVWFLVVLYREGLRKLHAPKFSPADLMSTAALAGCTGILAHSFVDFNLHVPANAALFYVLCGVATAPTASKSRSVSNSPGRNLIVPQPIHDRDTRIT